ncbi:glycoside hydrolase family 28 protein [Bythopirellula polymerisocia]|uniref:Endo-polygalacturonase n=1 Tax=Bythopirellula polymerisocia TaxID=2528003 RepID=A0A5C6D2F0_9BACT|nr:glycoside hydrolase family 28 protein [Bythopirellula polymerisocia]TWU29837.1 Endo-polygalacturonase precursor [Bythopirellula polymerisocia]
MSAFRVCLATSFVLLFAFCSTAFAETVFNVRDLGAEGNGVMLDTDAVQKAFDACGKAGGGTVLLPAGTYLCKPLTIRTNTTLRLEKGATLKATDDPADYARTDKPGEFNHFFTGKDLENVTIEGEGTIDGSGQKWWIEAEEARQKKSGYTLPRPNLIVLTRVKNLAVRGVTIQNAPKFHFVPTECENVIVEDAKFFAPERAPNTDAIDPSMCRNVRIRRCYIDVGDDNVAVKSGKPHPDREFAADTLLVEDCTIKHGHGISIGSEIVGGVKDVVVRNCTFEGTDNGIRIKTDRKKGGPVTNMLYENITMKDVAGAITITCYYPKIPPIEQPKPVTKTTPEYSNITIRNLTATSTKDAGFIVGLPESPIKNVLLENVKITSAREGLEIRHVEGIELVNVEIIPTKGEPLIVNDVEIEE